MKCVDRYKFERNKQKTKKKFDFVFPPKSHQFCFRILHFAIATSHSHLIIVNFHYFLCFYSIAKHIAIVETFPFIFFFVSLDFGVVSMVHIILVISNYILTTRSHFKTHLHIHKMPENCIYVYHQKK